MATVRELIRRMIPKGTHSEIAGWSLLPTSPIDVFAVAATLVERSGAYRMVVMPTHGRDRANEDRFALRELQSQRWHEIVRAWSAGFHPVMARDGEEWDLFVAKADELLLFPPKSDDERKAYNAAFKTTYYDFTELSQIDLTPLQQLWEALYDTHGEKKVVSMDGDAVEDWWGVALRLMIAADMAAAGVGFQARRRKGLTSELTMFQREALAAAAAANEPGGPCYLNTFTSDLIDLHFCAVLPKTRTASLGCTLRSLSHNLALLPSPGLVEARWRVPGKQPPSPIDTGDPANKMKSLNLLLVPFPFQIGSQSFVAQRRDGREDWSYFETRQIWLPKPGTQKSREFRDFFGELVRQAATHFDKIHGVIFPEFALDAATLDDLSEEFRLGRDKDERKDTGFEFIVAGLSEQPDEVAADAERRSGNYVAVRGVALDEQKRWDFNTAREKHHRWKLNKPQIRRYGLSSRLDPAKNWWEGIPLGRRRVEFFEPRAGTSMTVLICEDLARADPCQTVVRAVGPNLVLALLMDGPQRKSRWPGHYAGVLADDPGSSVLTLTSFGLIARGAAGDETQSRSVALFRNALGEERELFLPSGFHALAVRLQAEVKTEHTLDGRGDGEAAFNWSLHDVSPVRGPLNEKNRWIVEGGLE